VFLPALKKGGSCEVVGIAFRNEGIDPAVQSWLVVFEAAAEDDDFLAQRVNENPADCIRQWAGLRPDCLVQSGLVI
jgi:hypothetical protein